MKLLPCLILSLSFATSCNGQDKTQPHEIITQPNSRATGYPRLIKTQGTNQFAAVGCGLQDRAGNLWFGTGGEGVYRYDGKSFANFTQKDGLSSNSVISVVEDKEGNIWFGTTAGLCRYDPSAALTPGSELFTNIPISLENGNNYDPFFGKMLAGSQPIVTCMVQDKTGKIWFGTSNDGVYCYNPSAALRTGSNSFTHFLHNDSVINKDGIRLDNNITAIIEDKNGNIWFTTWFEGICRFDGKSLTSFKPNGEVWFGSVFEDKKGHIWVGRRHRGVVRYDPSAALTPGAALFTNVSEKGLFDSCGVCGMAEDKSGNIWFGTEFGDLATRENYGGVWCYDPSAAPGDSKSFKNYTVKDGLSNNCVFSVTIDKSGKLWFGSRGMGLCSFEGKTITDFSDKKSHDIRRIFEDQAGNLWFGTNGDGVCRYSPSAAPGAAKSLTTFSKKEGLSGTDVRCIAQDKTGNLWFGTDGGLSEFDGKQFTNFTVKEGLSDNGIWSMLIDRTGTVWVGTIEGVCRYNPSVAPTGSKVPPAAQAHFTSFAIPAAVENDFSREVSGTKIVWDIKEDKAGNIWFATNGGGVYRFDPSASLRTGSEALANISEKDGLSSNFVNSILEDKKGKIWFATQHGGVCCYNPAVSTAGSKLKTSVPGGFTTFTYREGLCSSEDWTMCEDKTGNIWIAGKSCGVDRYDPSAPLGTGAKTFTNYTDKEGILARNNVQSIFEDRKGNLWLGCSGSLFRFDGKSFINFTKEWALGAM